MANSVHRKQSRLCIISVDASEEELVEEKLKRVKKSISDILAVAFSRPEVQRMKIVKRLILKWQRHAADEQVRSGLSH